jgi:hypothetical protein
MFLEVQKVARYEHPFHKELRGVVEGLLTMWREG